MTTATLIKINACQHCGSNHLYWDDDVVYGKHLACFCGWRDYGEPLKYSETRKTDYNKLSEYQEVPCEICGALRFVQIVKGRPRNRICKSCSVRLQHLRRKVIPE